MLISYHKYLENLKIKKLINNFFKYFIVISFNIFNIFAVRREKELNIEKGKYSKYVCLF